MQVHVYYLSTYATEQRKRPLGHREDQVTFAGTGRQGEFNVVLGQDLEPPYTIL